MRPSPVSPAERLEHLLHPWTSFVVLPVFALANAGVPIRSDSFDAAGALAVAVGVVLGLAVRSGLGRLPEDVTWPSLGGVAAMGGIGFTVSLFIAELAYDPGPLQEAA